MYQGAQVKNFRGIRDLVIEDLRRVNLFVGANNVGKTSVLEAIWLFNGADDPARVLDLAAMRDFRPARSAIDQAWRGLFRNMETDQQITISAAESPSTSRDLVVSSSQEVAELVESRRQPTPLPGLRDEIEQAFVARPVLRFELRQGSRTISENTLGLSRSAELYRVGRVQNQNSVFMPAGRDLGETRLATMFTEAEDRGQLDRVVRDMKVVFPSLNRLSLGFRDVDNRPFVRAFQNGFSEPMPYYLFGEGAKRLLNLLLAMHSAEASLLLVDEFENGIYFEALQSVWENLNRTSQESAIQILATTHSWECVVAAVRAFRTSPDDFRLHRLERHGDDIRIVTYDHELAEVAIEEHVEVR